MDVFKLGLLGLCGRVNCETIDVEILECGKCDAIGLFSKSIFCFLTWVFAVPMAWLISDWMNSALEC